MKKITTNTVLSHMEEIVASVLFMCTLSLVVVNVITRYVFRTGIPWSEEFATGCFVWTVFVGSAACYKRRAHVGVDIIVNRLPRIPQNIVKITIDVLMLFLLSYMSYLSVYYVYKSYRKPTAILGISSATFSVSLPISFIDMAIWSLIFIFRDLDSIKKFGRVLSETERKEVKEC